MKSQSKPLGRPAIGKGEPVLVRLQPDLLAALDHFRATDPRGFTRPQAIRALMKMVIGSRAADIERRVLELKERGRRLQAQKGNDGALR